jgi:hypothetical protein
LINETFVPFSAVLRVCVPPWFLASRRIETAPYPG